MTPTPSIAAAPSEDERHLMRLKSQIERLNARENQLFAHQRTAERFDLALKLLLRLKIVRTGAEKQVLARDISRGGLSFLAARALPLGKIEVEIPTDAGESMWVEGEIVRHRQVNSDFWEHGVAFLRRRGDEEDPAEEIAAATTDDEAESPSEIEDPGDSEDGPE